MTPNEFCYWLQGYFELTDACCVNVKQAEIIRQHLDLVFEKKTTGVISVGNSWVTASLLNMNRKVC